jgi:hypothetical protein
VEKLGELLRDNPRGVLLFRDELTGFLRTLDREGHENDRGFYLEAWNGTGGYSYDRIARGTIDIEAACVSILGSIQPGPLGHYLRPTLRGGIGDDGLMQRFQLLVWPDIPPDWENIDRWPNSQAKEAAYEVFTRLDRFTVADLGATTHEDAGGIPFLRFDDAASELFIDWRTALERTLRKPGDHAAVQAHLSKYRSLVPSLALIIHLADGGKNPVTVAAIERALAWAEYLESHARRIYSHGLGVDYAGAQALADHISRGDLEHGFTARDVYRPQWADLTTSEEAARAIDTLVDLHWLYPIPQDTGGRPSVRYLINPKVQVIRG